MAPASTAASPPELEVEEVEELEVDEVEELEVEPDELVELDVPASVSGVVALSPHATATKPTTSPEAMTILRMMVVTLFLFHSHRWSCTGVLSDGKSRSP